MNKSYIIAGFVIAMAFAPTNNAATLPECNVNDPNADLVLTSTPDGKVEILGCSGAIESKGSSPYKEELTEGWLQNLPFWENDVLTNNTGGTTSTYDWKYLTKYLPNGNIESGEPGNPVFNVAFSCDGGTCDANDVAFDVDITFANTSPAALAYDQFVFLAKASNYYSLYQVKVLEGIQSLTGTLNMVSSNGLSHLTVWATNTGATPPNVAVNAPATFGLLTLAFAGIMLRRKRSVN